MIGAVEGAEAVRALAESDWEFDRVRAAWAASERHPEAELVGVAVSLFDSRGFEDQYPLGWHKGRRRMPDSLRMQLRVGPGVVGLRVHDPARASYLHNDDLPTRVARSYVDERYPVDVIRGDAGRLNADYLADRFLEERVARLAAGDGEGWSGFAPERVVTSWSRRSRTRMVERFAEIDWKPMLAKGIPAMVTLTYADDWLAVADCGRTVKRHMDSFRKRFERAWLRPLVGAWKLEFQGRGAPHVHTFIVPPTGRSKCTAHRKASNCGRAGRGPCNGMAFPTWLARAWASIVAHPDPEDYRKHLLHGTSVDRQQGIRALDPRRLGVYFLKHSSKTRDDKEYQNVVPGAWREPGKGPGRFWGFWGSIGGREYRIEQRRHVRKPPALRRAVVAIEIDGADFLAVKRVLRRWSRAQRRTRTVVVPRVNTVTGELRYRPVTRRAVRLDSSRLVGGFVIVNDGPAFASALARAVALSTWPQALRAFDCR